MNINPVNLKALTRNIPLANIYRYANLAILYDKYIPNPSVPSTTNNTSFGEPEKKLSDVLTSLRKIIKNALTAQETSNTREGLMAIYE